MAALCQSNQLFHIFFSLTPFLFVLTKLNFIIGLPGTPKLRTQKEEHFKEPRHDEQPVIPPSSFLQDLTQTRDNSYSSIKYATKHFTKHSSPFSKPLNFDETMANLKIEDSSSFIDVCGILKLII